MFCKKCGAELEEGLAVCPCCGEQQSGMDKKMKLIVSVLCIALLAAVLTVVIIISIKNKNPEAPAAAGVTDSQSVKTEQETTGEPVDETQSAASVVSYTVSDDVFMENRDLIVAELDDYKLTVAQLQIHYWFQVAQYYSNYKEYIYYGQIALDPTSPLDAQSCAENPTISWQEYFLQKAVNSWRSYVLLNMMADEAGFRLPADTMESMKADILVEAQANGFETAEEFVLDMLRKTVCTASTVEDYWTYQELINRANAYYLHWYESSMPTDAEVELYYKENEKVFVDGGAGKDAGNIVDVRHILVMVENDDWAAAEKEANEILQQFKAGGATEELFAQLANQYSDDGGSNTAGGLYSGVEPGQMVEVFNDWIMDDNRQYGDTAVLKADYHYQGYHVMYFVSGKPIWKEAAVQQIMSERSTEMATQIKEKGEFVQYDENIMLGTPEFE